MMNLIINLVMAYFVIGLFWYIMTVACGFWFASRVEHAGGRYIEDGVDTLDSAIGEEGFVESEINNCIDRPVSQAVKTFAMMILTWPVQVIFLFNTMMPMMIDKIRELKSGKENGD